MKKLTIVAAILLTAFSLAQTPARARRGNQAEGNTLFTLLRRADVQGELKLTDEQKTKLAELQPARGQRRNGAAAQRGNNEQSASSNATQSGRDRAAALSQILTPDQEKRLRELYVQRAGVRAVTAPWVQESLALTADQKAKLQTLQQKQREAQNEIMEKVRSGALDRSAVRDLRDKNEKVMGDEIAKILTPEQTAKLKAMGGSEFKFDATDQ